MVFEFPAFQFPLIPFSFSLSCLNPEDDKEKEKAMEGPSGDSEKEGPSMEAQMSLAAWTTFPGFRFSPTDEELISYYLQKKLEGSEKCVEVISEVEICRYEPWDLPGWFVC